jgi:hypothetical protein
VVLGRHLAKQAVIDVDRSHAAPVIAPFALEGTAA